MKTIKDAIAIVRSKANGRTRWEGQEPFLDELLVQEIDRLQARLDAVIEYLEDEHRLYDDSGPTGLYSGGFVRNTLDWAIKIAKSKPSAEEKIASGLNKFADELEAENLKGGL